MLVPGLDTLARDAFLAGFGVIEIAMATVWVALIGLALFRKLLSVSGS